MQAHSFHLSATRAYGGLTIERYFFSPLALIFYTILIAPFIRLYIINEDPGPLIIALLLLGFGLYAFREFNKSVLFNDQLPEQRGRNLAHSLSADMVRQMSKEEELTTFALLRAAISTKRGSFFLSEIGISKSDFLARFESEINKQIDVTGFLVRARELSDELNEDRIDANILLYYFFQHGGPFTELLNEKDLSLDDLRKIIDWERFHYEWKRDMNTWTPEKLLKTFGSFGRGWVTGYTTELDRLTTDIGDDILRKGERKVVIQTDEIETINHVLGRSNQQNVLILGKAGVGKRTLIENVTFRMRQHEVKNALPYTNVRLLHSEMLLSGTSNPDQFLLSALEQAKNSGRFLLVIDNLSVLLKAQNNNLMNVLVKFLNAPNISLIAIADVQDYHVLVKKDPTLDNMFEKVYVNDANDSETMEVLMMHYFKLEQRSQMHITYKALKSVLNLSKRYIGSGGLPGKAVSVLEDSALAAARRKDTYVTETDIREMVSLKAHMNVQTLNEDEKEKLLNLEDILREHVIGQEESLHALVNTLKRAKLDISSSKKPLGTFLFLGPTGVGKTETAKMLAEHYFGSKESMIRMDMNEYSNESSVDQIVGAPGAGEALSEGFLARRVQDRPFSLILLDEIEKAHPKVLNLFLQILDEGTMTDSLGVSTDFRNTIIIATSNAGALFIRDFIKENQDMTKDEFKQELTDTILKQGTFSPEFINRFDEVILYYPLSKPNAKRVAILMLDSTIKDLQEKRGVTLRMEEGVLDLLVERGYSQEFGAREMRRVVTNLIENFIADYMLKHDVQRGDEIMIKTEDLKGMLDRK